MPSSLSAHEWTYPAVIAVTSVSPVTGVGVNRSVVVLSPNSPQPLSPQQAAVPLSLSAHEWTYPAVIAVTSVSPVTGVGVNRSVVLPSPSWPS